MIWSGPSAPATVGAMPDLLHHWRFASDAARLVEIGGVLLGLAALTLLAERWQRRRKAHGTTGWIPWTGLFLLLAMAGFACLATGLPALLRNG